MALPPISQFKISGSKPPIDSFKVGANNFPSQEPDSVKQSFKQRIGHALIDPLKTGAQDVKNVALGVRQDFKQAAVNSAQGFKDSMAGKEDPFAAGFQAVGNFSKAAISPITETVGAGVNDIADKASNIKNVQNFANSKVGTAIVNTVGVPQNKYDEWAKLHPEASKNLEALGNIAALGTSIPAGGEAGALAKTGLDTTGDITKTAISKVVDTTSQVGENVSKVFDNFKENTRSSLLEKQANSYDEKLGINKNTKASIKQRLSAEKTGAKTPGKVLAENNIPLNNAEETTAALNDHIATLQATKQALLKTEGKWTSLDALAVKAKENLRLSGTDLETARTNIDKELAAYKSQYASKGKIVNGELHIPLDEADKIKSGLWRQSYGKGLTTNDSLIKTAQKEFGNSIKQAVEDTSENPHVQALNRQEGDFLNTKTAIEGKDISQLGKTSGYTRMARRVAGAVIGSPGGVVGAAVGSEAADLLGNVLSNVPSKIRDMIISNLKETPEGQSVLSKAQDIIKQRQSEQITRPQLESKLDSSKFPIAGRPGPSDVIDPGLKEVKNAKITKVKTVPVKYRKGGGPITQIFPGN